MSSITNLISVGVNGTGTANSVMKWLDADTATDSIIYDNGTNIGIGTSSPLTKLSINASESAAYPTYSNPAPGGFDGMFFASTKNSADAYRTMVDIGGVTANTDVVNGGSAIRFLTQPKVSPFAVTERMRIDSSVSITTNGAAGLILNQDTVNAVSSARAFFLNNNSGFAIVNDSDALCFFSGSVPGTTTGTTRMLIQSDSTIRTYYSAAFGQVHRFAGGASAFPIVFENGTTTTGSISISTTTTAYNTSSDYRLKENVVPMEGALDRVSQLQPSRFNFIADPETTVDGFLAHQVQDVVPEAITGVKDEVEEYEITPAVLDDEGNVIEEAVMGTRPVYQGIDQSKLVPLLVGAIQELKARIEILENK